MKAGQSLKIIAVFQTRLVMIENNINLLILRASQEGHISYLSLYKHVNEQLYVLFIKIMFKETVILLLLILGSFAEEQPVVKTKNGLVRGAYQTSRNGLKFVAFEGVPFAKPPISELRFKDPVPMEPWTGIWDATNVYQCMQVDHSPSNSNLVEGTEDCLYVNVYSPRINDDQLMDVIVHIHGGAFMFGHGDQYGPNNLMDRNIVYVNLNYRLGPLGFLSTEDEIIPGNMGLKDQSLALKWIKDNIEYFGGNPNSITITGLSAGGASVHFHYLSPLSKGLFHRGISFSGTALMNWALVEQPLVKTRQLGLLVGCGQQSTKDLVACLRQRSPKQIVQTVSKFQQWLYNPYSPFGPVVESAGSNQFLPDLPYNLLKDGKVADLPWITSVTSDEGLYPASDFVSGDRLQQLDDNWFKYAPFIMHYDNTATEAQQKEISQKIRDFYVKGEPISKETFPELVQAIGDRLFVVDAEKAAKLQAIVNKSPVYFYRFSFRGGHSITEYYSLTEDNYGVSHADDVMYVTSPDSKWFANYLKSSDDKRMAEILLDLWTSFARTGKPNVNNIKWTPVSDKQADGLTFLQISSPDVISLETAQTLGHRQFWDALPFTENDLIAQVKDEL